MSITRLIAAAAVVLGLGIATPAQALTPLERATESVVAITAGSDQIGTGFIIAPDRVLTVAHVVDAAAGLSARIVVRDRLEPYRVLAIDRERDLALLEVSLPSIDPIVWGRSADLTRGEDVIVLGFPIGLQSVSLTKGVVSSPLQSFQGVAYVQTDAAINPGNSGGPLVNEQGQLVGINVAKVAAVEVDAVGFSIPVDDARAFLAANAPDLEQYAVVENALQTGSAPSILLPAFAAVLLVIAGVAAFYVLVRRGRMRSAVSATPATVARYRFRVTGPGFSAEHVVALPAVLGSAEGADIRVPDGTVAAFAVRLSVTGAHVSALDLTDERGMYCADECVKQAILAPGDSLRTGGMSVLFVGVEQVPGTD